MDDPDDRERFADLIAALAMAFKVEVSRPLLQGYWLGLRDLPWERIDLAVAEAVATWERFPRPVDIRKLAGCQTAEMRSALAWEAVRKAIGTHGAYLTVQFSDPAATAAVRSMGGWVSLCNREPDELEKYVMRDFRKVYEEFSSAGVQADMARPLKGLFAAHDQPDPDALKVRLVPIAVEPARLLGDAPAEKRPGQVGGFVATLVRGLGNEKGGT